MRFKIRLMDQKQLRGFTLIEVMIAIGIIIIITSIIFAGISGLRAKNNDNAIRQSFALIRSEAEVSYKGNQRSYASVCTSLADARQTLPNTTSYKCLDGAQGYAVEMQLSTNMYYCVDARGSVETTATSIGQASTDCNGAPSNDCTCG